MDQEAVKQAVEEQAGDGPLTCAQARALAERLGVPYEDVGRACNELEVKIKACELGCF